MELTASQRQAWRAYLMGAIWGVLRRPAAYWMLLVLPRVVRGLWTTASAESAFDPRAVGDDGAAVGIAQFIESTWARTAKAGAVRQDPQASGDASVAYVQQAGVTWWVRLLTPGRAGLVAWRVLWTRGPDAAWPADDAVVQELAGEGTRGLAAWQSPPTVYYGAFLAPLVLGGAVLGLLADASDGRLFGSRRRRRRRRR